MTKFTMSEAGSSLPPRLLSARMARVFENVNNTRKNSIAQCKKENAGNEVGYSPITWYIVQPPIN